MVDQLVECIDHDCDLDSRDALRSNVFLAGGVSTVPFFEKCLGEALIGEKGAELKLRSTLPSERRFLSF